MTNEDDALLFRELVGEVEPLKHKAIVRRRHMDTDSPALVERRRAAQAAQEKIGNYLSRQDFVTLVKPWDLLSHKRDGVQHGVFRNLKQGRYNIDATIDLHRRSVEQARQEVFAFLHECLERDIRCAMITHGKGQHRDPPALLKSCVNHWLGQVDEVLAFHSAQPRHGGSGSTYVLLRKSRSQAQKNREKFSKFKGRDG